MTATGPAPGFTLIDVLCARALVECYLDQDYSETIEMARTFARLAEEGGGDPYEACHAGGNWARLNFPPALQTAA